MVYMDERHGLNLGRKWIRRNECWMRERVEGKTRRKKWKRETQKATRDHHDPPPRPACVVGLPGSLLCLFLFLRPP